MAAGRDGVGGSGMLWWDYQICGFCDCLLIACSLAMKEINENAMFNKEKWFGHFKVENMKLKWKLYL